ncbi:MAG: rhodanese-like domain-containing protein [Dehalococcoidia bacterium]|nr:rhodanese-like domain-containing protein [Dehalococcoidia bacterium]MYK26630.1 rhodanese-like domain-containing protein [Dehalococcoidia bacterium]
MAQTRGPSPDGPCVLGFLSQRTREAVPVATKDPREPFTRLSIEEAKEKLDSGDAVMVDVRDPHEYVEVHAKGVRLIPVNTVMTELDQIREFAGDKKEVLFICKMGGRSALAAEYATAAGLEGLELFNVEGGTDAWAEAGFPTGD